MILSLLNKLSASQKGTLSLIIGFILVFGAFDKLGFLQQFLNIFLIVVGGYLLLHGLHATNLMGKFKFFKK